jgi:hypothetical protein
VVVAGIVEEVGGAGVGAGGVSVVVLTEEDIVKEIYGCCC